MKINTYTKKERNMYLTGLAGQNIIYNVIATGMAYYFQSVLFIPAMALSVIMAVARVWDAINDPMMGSIVDKTRTKWGKMRPYLMFVPSIIFVTTILTFINKPCTFETLANGSHHLIMSPANIFIIAWAGISYILWGMSYTAGDIPIWGITSLMTEDRKDREKLLGFARVAAGVGAISLVGFIPGAQAIGRFLEGSKGMSANKGLYWGCIIIAIALTLLGSVMFQCASYAKEHVPQPSSEHKTIKQNFKMMWDCKPFRRLLISGVIRSPMNILSLVAMMFLSYYFGDNGGDGQDYMKFMVILGGGMFVGMFGAMAIAPSLCQKYEKKRLHNFCCIASSIPFVALFAAYLIDGTHLYQTKWLVPLAIIFTIAGAGTGIMNVIQSIMIADCVDYDEYRTGYRPDGVFFSGQSFITKFGAGISSLIQGAVFSAVGFSGAALEKCNELIMASPKTDFMFATAPEFASYRFGMFFLISIPSAVGFALCVIPMLKYEITNEEHERILKELNEKRNATEN